ncbi:hypothetical protein T09_14603 [Trichinella sp. T9]|nr:hypothetical protein T09_14603 [Trichinella sp. T9]
MYSEIKVMHHTNVGITGTIGRNLRTTTISYKHKFNCTWRKSKQYNNGYNIINVRHDTVCIYFGCAFLVSIYLFYDIKKFIFQMLNIGD